MNVEIIHVASIWSDIFLSCKTCQTFSKDESSKGINPVEKTIYSKIKLEIVNEIWFMKILLNHILLTWFKVQMLYVIPFIGKEYSLALRQTIRFYDEGCVFILLEDFFYCF
jgi:hypothetical protein